MFEQMRILKGKEESSILHMDWQPLASNVPLNIHLLDFNTYLKSGFLIKKYYIPDSS